MGLTPMVKVRLPNEPKRENIFSRLFGKLVIRPDGYIKEEAAPRLESIHSLDVEETTDEELDVRIEKIRHQFEQRGFTTTSSFSMPTNFYQTFWGDGPYGDQPDPKHKLGVKKELR